MPDAMHQQCVDATVAVLKGLALPRIGANVVTQLLEQHASLQEPVAVVTTEGQPIPIAALTTASRVVEYPVRVRVQDRVASPGAEKLPEWTLWEEAVLDAFPDRRQPGYPPGIIGCRLSCRAGVAAVPGKHQLAEGEWLLLFRGVRPS